MRGLARTGRSAIWQAEGRGRGLAEAGREALAGDRGGPVVFGSDGHGWRARPPISEEEAATYGSLTGG